MAISILPGLDPFLLGDRPVEHIIKLAFETVPKTIKVLPFFFGELFMESIQQLFA
jgi:hypothetical protein